MVKNLLLLCFILTLSACASPYPLGMSEEQWQKLSPNERQTLLVKQQAYDEQQRLERIKAQAKQRELQLALELQEEKRLASLHANPGSGDIMMVNFLSGEYHYNKKTYQIQPTTQLIARGETQKIWLSMRDKKGRNSTEYAYLHYNRQGTGIYLSLNRSFSYNDDHLTILRDGRWECGSSSRHQYTFNNRESIQNLNVFIKDNNSRCQIPYYDSRDQHKTGRPIFYRR